MTKLKRTEDGGYLIKGKKYETLRGTRRQVYEYETAYKTAGGLLKGDLVQNDKGRIVSKAKFDDGPNLLKNLTKRGFFTKKGKFGHTKMKTRKLRKKLTRKNRRKMKGGSDIDEARDKIQEVKKQIKLISKDAILNNIPENVREQIPEDMINSLLKPLESLFKAKDKLETKLDELEKALDEGEKELNEKVTEITDLIDEELGEKKINDLIDTLKIGVTNMALKVPKEAVRTGLIKFMEPIREEMKNKIKEIAKSPISTAAEVANSIQKEKPAEEEPAEEEKKELAEEEPADIEKMEETLDPKTQDKINEQLAAVKRELVEAEISPKVGAEETEKKIEEMTKEMGGKKKSKGKK
tara:strand:- start:204 stop:1262 length:1059 start_codon:yes stop_codon:yes gene_type:complete